MDAPTRWTPTNDRQERSSPMRRFISSMHVVTWHDMGFNGSHQSRTRRVNGASSQAGNICAYRKKSVRDRAGGIEEQHRGVEGPG